MPIKTRIGNMFGQNGSQSKYKCSIIQTGQNNLTKYKHDKMQNFQKNKHDKIQKNKIQMQQNTSGIKYK